MVITIADCIENEFVFYLISSTFVFEVNTSVDLINHKRVTGKFLIHICIVVFCFANVSSTLIAQQMESGLKGDVKHIKEEIFIINEDGTPESNSVVEYFYAQGNQLIQRTSKSKDFFYKDTLIYSNDGRLIEEIVLAGQFINRTKYEYNDDGKVERTQESDADGKITKVATYIYESNGSYKTVYSDGDQQPLGEYIITVDEYDRETTLKYIRDDSPHHQVNHKYNKNGDVIEEIGEIGDFGETITTYIYVYDDHSNWIEKTIVRSKDNSYYGSASDTKYVRTITYRD